MSEQLDAALTYAALGWHVLPLHSTDSRGQCSCGKACSSAGKHPRTDHGKDDATTDEGTIRTWWGRWPDANVGIVTGAASGLFVVDVDANHADGVDGYEAWREIVEACGPQAEQTTIVDTPSGGQHVYYQSNGHRLASTAGKLGPGLDTRGDGGYVVAPGSAVGGVPYTFAEGHDLLRLSPIPDRLVSLVTRSRTPAAKGQEAAAPAGSAVPEGERHRRLLTMAGSMRRAGFGADAIEAALLKVPCSPPHDPQDIHRMAVDIAAKPSEAQNGPAAAAVEFIDFAAADFWDRDADAADWILPDVLARGRGHAIYAAHKVGKSLFMLHGGAKLATSAEQVVVVYLDYEMTPADVRDRLEDMGYGPTADLRRLRYALLPSIPPLDTADGGSALTTMLDAVQAEFPEHHMVVIIDTISRAVAGEENPADTWRDFYRCTGIELKRRGITWARLDHGGKDLSRGQRGSSGKGDDVDVVWRLSKTDSGLRLDRDVARMPWVPERAVFHLEEDPLRFRRTANDWPAGTAEVGNLLSRLDIPLNATSRAAQAALKSAGHGRRRQLVTAALQWRVAQLAGGE